MIRSRQFLVGGSHEEFHVRIRVQGVIRRLHRTNSCVLKQRIDRASRPPRLLGVDLECRRAVQRSLLRVVLQIVGEHDRSGLLRLDEQYLVPGRVAGRPF